MKTVKYCDAFEAEVIRGRLESEGITACLLNELTVSMLPWSTGSPYAAVQVAVAEENYERAMALLAERAPAMPEMTEICCPECGSKEVVYGFWENKKCVGKFMGVMAIFGIISTGGIRNRYTCQKCGYEFKP